MNLGIIGAGKVGTTVGYLLQRRGYSVVGIRNRTDESTARAAALLETRAASTAVEVAAGSDLVLITTPDGRIEEVCREVATGGGFRPGQVVLHMSGALSSSVLASARERGARVASLHPLQSFARFDPAASLAGVYFTAEGDTEALRVSRDIASKLEGRYLEISPEAKVLYHASACVMSNYFVALMDFGVRLFSHTGVKREEALAAMLPLVEGTLANLKQVGLPHALTGPISRGDVLTIRKHLVDLNRLGPETLELYKALGRHTVQVARAKGTLDDRGAGELLHWLQP